MPPDDPAPALAEALLALAARAGAASPLPRGLPYLGLDHPSGTSLEVLADLGRHGIFRKYEQVLDLGGALGAAARWAVQMLGCTAVCTAAAAETARAGRCLTERAGLGDVVSHLAADPQALPLREGAATHVWAIEWLSTLEVPTPVLAEARRVVRPGGHLAVQELVPRGTVVEIEGRWLRSAEEWRALIGEAGFVDLTLRDVSEEAEQIPPRLQAAREQLLARSAVSGPACVRAWARRLERTVAARAAGRLGVVQLFGRRP